VERARTMIFMRRRKTAKIFVGYFRGLKKYSRWAATLVLPTDEKAIV
jgi:hypothetical protein